MQATGYKYEPYSFKDRSYERAFGATSEASMYRLNRMEEILKTDLPVVYQGANYTCVSCSVTWLQQYRERQNTYPLSWNWLAVRSDTADNGATLTQVFEVGRKTGICEQDFIKQEIGSLAEELNAAKHRTGKYYFVRPDKISIFAALRDSPVIIGVSGWGGVEDHCLVAVDVTEDLSALECINWWEEDRQARATVSWEFVVDAAVYRDPPPGLNVWRQRVNPITVLADKLKFYFLSKKGI